MLQKAHIRGGQIDRQLWADYEQGRLPLETGIGIVKRMLNEDWNKNFYKGGLMVSESRLEGSGARVGAIDNATVLFTQSVQLAPSSTLILAPPTPHHPTNEFTNPLGPGFSAIAAGAIRRRLEKRVAGRGARLAEELPAGRPGRTRRPSGRSG